MLIFPDCLYLSKWACDSDSRKSLFLTKNGRTWHYYAVTDGRPIIGVKFCFGQDVQNWCRKGFWKFRSSIPFRFLAMLGNLQGRFAPPPSWRRLSVDFLQATQCLLKKVTNMTSGTERAESFNIQLRYERQLWTRWDCSLVLAMTPSAFYQNYALFCRLSSDML